MHNTIVVELAYLLFCLLDMYAYSSYIALFDPDSPPQVSLGSRSHYRLYNNTSYNMTFFVYNIRFFTGIIIDPLTIAAV